MFAAGLQQTRRRKINLHKYVCSRSAANTHLHIHVCSRSAANTHLHGKLFAADLQRICSKHDANTESVFAASLQQVRSRLAANVCRRLIFSVRDVFTCFIFFSQPQYCNSNKTDCIHQSVIKLYTDIFFIILKPVTEGDLTRFVGDIIKNTVSLWSI